MAVGDLRHIDVGPQLTKTEWEAGTSHQIDGGTPGSLLIVSGGRVIELTPGIVSQVLGIFAGLPAWVSMPAAAARTFTTVTAAMTPYTVLAADDIILADLTAGILTLDLPTAIGNLGKEYTIIKISSDANVLTVDGFGAQTINGSITIEIDVQYTAMDIISDGANWRIV